LNSREAYYLLIIKASLELASFNPDDQVLEHVPKLKDNFELGDTLSETLNAFKLDSILRVCKCILSMNLNDLYFLPLDHEKCGCIDRKLPQFDGIKGGC
jgi:hypothetical protein